VIPVITGEAGTILGPFIRHLNNAPGENKIKELQRITILHCTYTAESTNVKEQNIFNMRNNITCSTNCKYRAATHYVL
jgi:hypothetical protein